MRKGDVLVGLMGKPAPFDAGGFTVHLRLISNGDRAELMEWYAKHRSETGAGIALQNRLVALAVVDPESCDLLLTEKDVGLLPATAVDAISLEVSRRNGMKADAKLEADATPATAG